MSLPERSLSILDVGHGNSSVLHTSNGTVVIDAGLGGSLLRFLRSEGVQEIDLVLISHADQDHIGGLLALLSEDVSIKKVRVNTDSLKGSATWDDLLYELDKNNTIDFQPILTSAQTGEFDIDGLGIEVLAPSPYLAGKGPGSSDREGRKITNNSISALIRILDGNRPVAVTTGDIDNVGLTNFSGTQGASSAPILIFPHHGGLMGSLEQTENAIRKLIDITSPDTVIFSIGRGKHGTPRDEVVSTIRALSHDVRIMCTQLSKNCSETLPEVSQRHLNDVYACGRQDKKCCAGTIVVDLSSLQISPEQDSHSQYVSSSIPNALCMN